MPAHKKPQHLKKTKVIKIMVTPGEFERYQSPKIRLSSSSPTLHTYDILNKCVNQIDDYALIEFLQLPADDPIRVKLQNDYMMNRIITRS